MISCYLIQLSIGKIISADSYDTGWRVHRNDMVLLDDICGRACSLVAAGDIGTPKTTPKLN